MMEKDEKKKPEMTEIGRVGRTTSVNHRSMPKRGHSISGANDECGFRNVPNKKCVRLWLNDKMKRR